METRHKILWQVSLNSGETFHEEKGNYKTLEGEKSPWKRLQDYLLETDYEITSLSAYSEDGRRFSLPSAGKNPQFREFAFGEKPVGYNMFRKIAYTLKKQGEGDVTDHFTVLEAKYETFLLQLWIDHKNENLWTLIKNNGTA